MACVCLVELYLAMGRPLVEDIACVISFGDDVFMFEPEVRKTIDTMLDWGHRYKNLEKASNEGICFTLGCDLSESQSVNIIIIP